ncbi:DUF2970 domain-containing protein [Pulveribacter suum]|uniref:DUF2970 domain-containing protein n=1 Tax=Pulveribacter suum TaxID=2116657 RepID=A0A2P1NIY7_9BURK|nr:DUF2970 domain-containing protein [Pulveribacter suum]AVP57034.1 hypothetical protein C7H73_04750 [Pulveribacter suum]
MNPQEQPPEPPRKTSLVRTLRAVAWSLIGLRAGEEYRRDLQSIHPLHVLLVGLIALFAFVAGLILLVKWVV